MKKTRTTALGLALLTVAAAAQADLTLYENDDFGGRSVAAARAMQDLRGRGFNDRASSVVVTRERWEVCEDDGFNGRCMVLRPGSYPSLRAMGLNDRISSARPLAASMRVADDRYGPTPLVAQDFRRRQGERLFQADVRDVHAVVSTPQQTCWIEREQVTTEEHGPANVGGAVIGAVIGGILGHQIGGGTGRDIATAGGVLGGAALGANVNRDSPRTGTRDVQRCREVASGKPDYWDVTYVFRGREHHVQMTSPPGQTVTVNNDGEPRS